jgi:hypothetical protein
VKLSHLGPYILGEPGTVAKLVFQRGPLVYCLYCIYVCMYICVCVCVNLSVVSLPGLLYVHVAKVADKTAFNMLENITNKMCMFVLSECVRICLHMSIYVCMYVCMHRLIYTCVGLSVYIYICIYMYIYVYHTGVCVVYRLYVCVYASSY